MSPYQGAEKELYEEAIRVVAGVTAARVRGSEQDVLSLHLGFQISAQELRIPKATAWSILYAASISALHGMVNLAAEVQGTTQADVAERMVFAAVEQVATGAL